MKLNVFLVSILILVFIGCQSSHELKPGIYKFSRPSRIESVLRYVFQGVTGLNCSARSLQINKDSTFIYERYPFTFTGNWQVVNDSLSLVIIDYGQKPDSLYSRLNKGREPYELSTKIAYKIREKLMIR